MSKQYNNDRKFINSPTVDLQHWNNGYQWAKSNKDVEQKVKSESVEYYCPVGANLKITADDVKNVKEIWWNTFEQFKWWGSSVWIVNIPDSDEKLQGNFSCPCFLKKYLCKHFIGLAICLKLAKPPATAICTYWWRTLMLPTK